MVEINQISIIAEGLIGEFSVDSLMGVWFSSDLMYWETHLSMLNETHYESIYKSFMEMMHEEDESEWFNFTFDQFKYVMERLFQAYRLIKGEL